MRILFILISIVCMSELNAQTDWPNLKRYEAANAALEAPAKNENRIVFMGNSITEGWKRFDSSFFLNNPYINRGISGQTTSQMLIRFRPDVIALKPKAVVILAGINDIAENTGPIAIKDIAGNIFSMAELAKANKIEVLICSVLPANSFGWRKDLQPADKVIELNNLLKDYCNAHKITYVDYYSKMVDAEKGLNNTLGYDAVHPNAAGYAVMKSILLPFLEKYKN